MEELDLQKNQISDGMKMQKTLELLPKIKKVHIGDNCFVKENKLNDLIIETCPSLEELNGDPVIHMRNTTESKTA